MRIAALIKQVPRFEQMQLGPDGRLVRTGIELEMSAYCRRAVSKAAELAAASGGSCTVISLGPESAEDVVREAVAWALRQDADVTGWHVCDPAFAGSDTLATARALAAVLRMSGPYDLVLVGRNSIDAETGQVGPEVAELLGLPFVAGVRELAVVGRGLELGCERDDGWQTCTVTLPAVLSVAERLCAPAKVDPNGRAAVPAQRIRRLAATDLGGGPWGQPGSPTRVGRSRTFDVPRAGRRLSGRVDAAVRAAVDLLVERDALRERTGENSRPVPPAATDAAAAGVVVLLEPERDRPARELLGTAAELASAGGGRVVGFGPVPAQVAGRLAGWGADELVVVTGAEVEEDVAAALVGWLAGHAAWAVLAPGTLWGREVAARIAARLGAGLTGDAVGVEVDAGRLVAWKPAFGGRLVAAIHASSPVHLATVRPGVLPLLTPRATHRIPVTDVAVVPSRRVQVRAAGRDDDLDLLVAADRVVAVGTGVQPDEYPVLRPLLAALGAELAATRKVTDKGWLPRSRQVGITGRSIAPQLYVALGIHGKFNHVVGVRGAGTVLAVNCEPAAPIFDAADIGIVADWHDVVPLLTAELGARLASVASQ